MSTIVTRAGKGSPLTWNEVDNNFTNLNTDKYQSGSNASFGTIAGTSITSSALTSGRVTFASTGGLLADSANLVWDNANATFDVSGAISARGSFSGTQSAGQTLLTTTGLSINRIGANYIGVGTSATHLAFTAPYYLFMNQANTIERMRIDSSGNLGLGVTPSAWRAADRAFDIGQNGSLYSQGGTITTISANEYLNASSQRIYKTNGFAGSYSISSTDGVHRWNQAATGTAGNAITFTTAMTLNASGNLGIGTASPTRKITIAGTTNAFMDFSATSFRRYTLGSESNGFVVFDDTAGAYRMIIDANGNVGVGTTPSAWGSNFKVIESTGGSSAVYAANNINGLRLTSNLYNDNTNFIYKTTGGAAFYSINTSIHQWFNAPSGTAGTTATLTQAMTLDASGRLGIGTTSPAYNLTIGGGTGSQSQALIAGSAGASTLRLDLSGTGTFTAGFNNSGATVNNLPTGVAGMWMQQAYPVIFGTNATERMRIDSSGNVGIGTTSPIAGYKLDVNGSINVSGNVKLTNANATNISLYNTAASAINYGVYSANTAANGFNGFGILDITNSSYRLVIGASGGVSIGNTTDRGAASLNLSGLFYPVQSATAPAYVKGAIYFDTTLNKLRVGGATAWETITSA